MIGLRKAWDAFRIFWRDVLEETRRCEWPSRGELTESTLVVIVFLFLLAIYVGVADRILVGLAKRLFRV